MKAGCFISAPTVGIESLEPRRLFAITLSPLQSTVGVRFNSIDSDAAGNIFAVGDFQGQATFDKAGKIKLTSLGDNDAFIMRIAASNGAIIVRRLGSTTAPTGVQKIVSPLKMIVQDGHVTVTGTFSGHLDLDPTKGTKIVDSAGDSDVFIVDLSASALAFNWATAFGGAGADSPQDLDRDSVGNTWAVGYFPGTITFPGAPTHQLKSAGDYDSFISKFGPTGQYLFSTRVGGAGTDALHSVAVDSHNNVFLAGTFQKTIDTDPSSKKSLLTTAGTSTSGMLIELSSAGAFKASRGFIDTGFASITDIEIDSTDAIYTLVNFDGTIDADPSSKVSNITTKGFGDILVTKLNSTLTRVWSNTIGAAGTEQAQGMYVDLKGQVLLSGTTQDTVDLDPSKAKAVLTNDGAGDGFVVALSAAGKFQGAAQIGGTGDATAYASGRSNGSFVLGVNYQNVVDLAPRRLPPSGTPPTPSLLDVHGTIECAILLIAPTLLGST